MSHIQAAFERILAEIDKGGSVADLMRADETAAGRLVIRPGQQPWLAADDWDESVVVSIDRGRVRLVALLARNPRHGALRRTIDGIKAAGLVPVIVEPVREMRETCRRWGWKMKHVGNSFETREEQWMPRAREKGRHAEHRNRFQR